jgi:hypothetical protein
MNSKSVPRRAALNRGGVHGGALPWNSRGLNRWNQARDDSTAVHVVDTLKAPLRIYVKRTGHPSRVQYLLGVR